MSGLCKMFWGLYKRESILPFDHRHDIYASRPNLYGYYYLGDPGGNIPAWVANTVIEESPFRMLTNFHKLVKLDRYKGKKFGFIK